MTEIVTEPVRFASGEEELVGVLHRLAGASDGPAPALVVTGAWMTVKEQMPTRYAREMAARGWTALVFDFAGWGASGGLRRQYEDPQRKIADVQAAVDHLAARDDVDARSVGALGICASSGYVVHAADRSDTIRSVALVAPWLHDAEIVENIYGGAEAVAVLKSTGDDAAKAYVGGTPCIVPAASLTDDRAVMYTAPYYTETDRGLIPTWRNEADLAFWRGWLEFDAIAAAPAFDKPLLMVESDAAAAPQGARKFAAAMDGRAREVWLDDVTQFDFYDQAAAVTRSADEAAEHFADTLT